MEIKRLNSDVISKIRSSFTVNSVPQCVFELISNSLDAKSTSIAVRINLITFKIQVADNGEGISRDNLELVGVRYMTNKCHNARELDKHLSTYGFKGETLASIVDMCRSININSRCKNCSETYSKTLSKNFRSEVKSMKHRASVGTTVTVLGFLGNFPVRQKRIIQEIELEEVKKHLESLVIINPGTSFSLRNDVTGLLILNCPKSSDIIGSFRHLHPDITDSFTHLKISKNKVCIDALIHREFIVSKKFQYVYVNKRPVSSHKILKDLNNSFYKKMQLKTKRNKHPIYETRRYPVFVLNIKCPEAYIDVLMGPTKSDVEFECWDLVLACIEKIVKVFFGLDDKKENIVVSDRKANARLSYGVSQVAGAVQACAYKRKSDETMADDDGNVDVTENSLKNKPVCVKKSKLTVPEKKKERRPMTGNKKPLEGFVKDKTTILSSKKADCSGSYQIEDSGKEERFLKPRKLKSIIKKPLPIRVEPKSFDLQSKLVDESIFEPETTSKRDELKEFNLSECRSDLQLVAETQFDQKSVYSKLNNDEDQGKNLIMDMFLKSTQVFTGQDGKSEVGDKTCPNVSADTIEESKFTMEKNIHDIVRGINTTMSVNVNVKKRRMKDDVKVSKCIQTSIVDKRSDNLTSKCVQTSQKPTLERVRSNLSELTHRFDGFKLSHDINGDLKDNYTILVNTVRKKREFRFVRKSEEINVDSGVEEHNFRPLKICHCREDDGKIFNFDKGGLNFNKNQDKEATFKKPQALVTEPKLNMKNQEYENKIRNILNFRNIKKQSGSKVLRSVNVCERSPYFDTKSIQRLSSCDLERKIDMIPPRDKRNTFRRNLLQNNIVDNHSMTAGNNVVSSPYFNGDCRKDYGCLQKSDVCLVERSAYAHVERQSDNDHLQNGLNHVPHRLSLHPNKHFVCGYPNFEHNCIKAHTILGSHTVDQNMCHNELIKNYCRLPNTNYVSHFCCRENVPPPKEYPEIDRHYLGLPRKGGNEVALQNCCRQTFNCYKRDDWHNVKLNIERRSGYHPQTGMGFAEQGHFAKNARYKIPGLQQNNFDGKQGSIVDKNARGEPGGNPSSKEILNSEKIMGQTIVIDENEDCALEEAPWYTPNVSDENMYFEETLPEEAGHKKTVVDGVQNICTLRDVWKVDEQDQKAGKEKKQFNFKFSCTPDIFSSELFGETGRDPETNEKTIINSSYKAGGSFGVLGKNDADEPVRNDVHCDFSKFFDLASFGIDTNKKTNAVCQAIEGSDLEITLLDDQEKQNIIEEELAEGGTHNRNHVFSGKSEVTMAELRENEKKSADKSRVVVDSQNEWVRKYNDAGRGFYVNRRTGMISTFTPKIDQGVFCFDRRLDFVPKGMSPVLKGHKKVDRFLSQKAKNKLQDFILESYENELMVVKWQRFISDDPKTFFEEIYKEKSKQFENGIPSIPDGTLKDKLEEYMVGFSSKMFKAVDVIGQVDKKFIAVLEKNRNLVILLDQHAVHERIRVEQLLKVYKGVRTHCKEKLTYFMPRNDLGLLKKHSAYLNSLGLDVEFFTDGLKILNIPLCLQEKFNLQDNSEEPSKIINVLMKEIIESLRETRGSTTQLPKVIQNVVNLKACRGAIKFGDILTREDCIKLLNDLAKCKLPFQCAHGRPTLWPVLRLSKVELTKKGTELDLQKLLKCT